MFTGTTSLNSLYSCGETWSIIVSSAYRGKERRKKNEKAEKIERDDGGPHTIKFKFSLANSFFAIDTEVAPCGSESSI